MEGPVTWPQLYLIAGLTVAVNVSCALFVGWLVYRACEVIAEINIRLTKLEDQLPRKRG